MALELYDIYDAEDGELLAELSRLKNGGADLSESSRKIIDHIEQELFERGVSGSISNQLGEALAVESSTVEVPDASPASPSTPAPVPYKAHSSSSPGSEQRRRDEPGSSSGAMQKGHTTPLSYRDADAEDSESGDEDQQGERGHKSPASTSTTPPLSTSKSEPETPQAQRSSDQVGSEQSSPSESPSVLDAAIIAFREERNRLASARKFNKQKKFIQDREAILSLAERRKQYAGFLAKKTEKARLKAQKQAKKAAKNKSLGNDDSSPSAARLNPWKGGGTAAQSSTKNKKEERSPSPPKASKAKVVSPQKPKSSSHQQKEIINVSARRKATATTATASTSSTSANSNSTAGSRNTNQKLVVSVSESQGGGEKDRSAIQVLKGKIAQKHNLASNGKKTNSSSTSGSAQSKQQEKDDTTMEADSINLNESISHADADCAILSVPDQTEMEQPTSPLLVDDDSNSTKSETEMDVLQSSDTEQDRLKMQERTEDSKEDQNKGIGTQNEEGGAVTEKRQTAEQPEQYHESASEVDESRNSEQSHVSAANSPQQAERESAKQSSMVCGRHGTPDTGVVVANGADGTADAINAISHEEIVSPQSSIEEQQQQSDAHKEVSAVQIEERPVEGVAYRVEAEAGAPADDIATNQLTVNADEAADEVSVDISEGKDDVVLVNIHPILPKAKRTLQFVEDSNQKGAIQDTAEMVGEDAIVIDVPSTQKMEMTEEHTLLAAEEAEINNAPRASKEEESFEASIDEKQGEKEEECTDDDHSSSDNNADSPSSSSFSPLDDDLHNHSPDQTDDTPLAGKPHIELDTILHPYAGAARSLTIREIPNLETNNPLSEWIRPTSAHNGLSAWGGTPSPPSSPTYMSISSKFEDTGGDDCDWTQRFQPPDIGPIEATKKVRAPIVSPKKQIVNYAAIYDKIEEIFVRFIGEEKLSEGRPFSGRKRPTSAKLTKRATAKYTDQDILDFLEKYKGSLYSWLKTFHIKLNKVLEAREEEQGGGEDEGSVTTQNQNNNNLHMVYKVTDDKPEVYKLVTASFHSIGDWHEDVSAEGGVNPQWNILWSWASKPKVDRQSLNIWQRINHYPGANQLTRKDTLKKNLQYCKSLFKHNKSVYKLFDIMPLTFSLPTEYVQFCNAFSENITFEKQDPNDPKGKKSKPKIIYGSENTWIMKPVSSSRGRGIFLINSIEEVEYGEAFVIQKYVSNPLLIHKHKFDLRLYVLVTCFNPLEAWLYKEGFARFCSVPYSTEKDTMHDKYVHLTNSSVQQTLFKDPDFALPECLRPMISDNPLLSLSGGSKRSLKYLQDKFEDYGINWDPVWQEITSAVLAALFSAQKKIPFQPNSFELFGFDVMIDSNLKVWLLEVNASPSLGIQTELDQYLKKELICDVLKLVDPAPYDRSALLDVVQKKICDVSAPRSHRNSKQQQGGGGGGLHMSTDQKLLQADLHSILDGMRPRQYGEQPNHVGKFERIAPSQSFNQFDRLLRKPS